MDESNDTRFFPVQLVCVFIWSKPTGSSRVGAQDIKYLKISYRLSRNNTILLFPMENWFFLEIEFFAVVLFLKENSFSIDNFIK